MKIFFTYLILIFLSISMYSQEYFSRRYDFDNENSIDFGRGILEYQNKYISIGGFNLPENYNYNNIGILVLNQNGEVESRKNILSDSEWGYDVLNQSGGFKSTSNNQFYSVGVKQKYTVDWLIDKGVIYKFNSELDTLWTKSFGDKQEPADSNYFFKHFEILTNNELAIIGTIVINGENSVGIMLKTDSLGNELWRKYFYSGPLNDGRNIIQTSDGGFALSGYKWTFGTHQTASPYVIKTDSLGNEQWRKYFDSEYDRIDGVMYLVNSPDNKFIGVYSYSDSVAYPSSDTWNRDAVVKFNLEGEILWEKYYAPEFNNWITSAAVTDNGKVIASGFKYSPFSHRVGYLFNFSNNGDSLWSREYEILLEYESLNYLYGVTPTSDGGYAAVGNVYPYPPDIGNWDAWVLKVDSMGCESPTDCWVGEKEVFPVGEIKNLSIYPNPSRDIVNIVVPRENESDELILSFYNLYGIKVKETLVPNVEEKVVLNIESWQSSMYVVSLANKGRVLARGKFIKQ